MIIGVIAFGLLIGLSLGALGGGGSILTVPVLVFVFDLTAKQATAGSLVIVGITAAIGSIGHARAGNTLWGKGIVLALVGIPASLLGTDLNKRIDPNALLLAFAALMIVAAIGMLRRSHPAPSGDVADPGAPPTSTAQTGGGGTTLTAPAVAATRTTTRVAAARRTLLAGLGIGFLTGFLGVGGGFIIVPVLVVLLEYPMAAAVGTSLLVIALNSVVALAARLGGHTSFSWHVIVPFTAAAVVASLAGKQIADKVDARALTRAFAVLLVAVAIYVAAKASIGLS